MLQSLARSTPRRVLVSKFQFKPVSARQFLSTAPPSQKTRSWKGVATRWAIAIGTVYFYNTSPVFADQPNAVIAQLDGPLHSIQESKPPTLEAISEEKKMRQAEQNARDAQTGKQNQNENNESQKESTVEELEEEGEELDQQGAFNPETGEINWECPCLGGMAHGPCGDEFKAAFSCFVYSKEEPKGMECIGKFKDMQDCFRQHPETYSSELAGDEDEDEIEEELKAGATAKETELSTTSLPSAEATTSLAQ